MTPPLLASALDEFNSNDLGYVLSEAGVVNLPKTKQAKIELWLELVGDPDRIRRALAKLTPPSRRALELLQGIDADVRTERFRSLLLRTGVVTAEEMSPYGGYSSSRKAPAKIDPSKPSFSETLEELLRSGLIWTHTLSEHMPSNARLSFDGGRFVYIPREVAQHLPPAPIKHHPLPAVTQTLEGSARTCQRDLYLVWSASRETPLQLTNAGLLRVSDLKRIAGQLLMAEDIAKGTKESDYRRIFFLRRLATELNVLDFNAPANLLEAPASPNFISQAPPQRVRLSFQCWRDGDWWNELLATMGSSTTPSNALLVAPAPAGVASARRVVLETLARLAQQAEREQRTPAAWVAVDDINDYLRERNDEFLVDRATAEQRARGYGYRYSYSYSSLYSPYEYNSLGWNWAGYQNNEEAGWNGVERVFLRTVLTEGLYWLGLVDLGYPAPVTVESSAAPPDLVAVRLTDMGRWLLLDGPQPEVPEEGGRVVVQPNFRIFAFDPISDAVLARLDGFASRQNAERAIEYELSRDSVYGAQQTGQSGAQIRAWLEQVTGAPLPQNVARSMEEWQAAFERITVRNRVGWLEAATPDLIDALLDDPRWKRAIIKRATPTGIIVRADKVANLEQALLAAGELPARNSDPESARRASITVDESGLIGFVHATPSLYVYGYLRPFCEQTEAGWRITARSIAQASAAGLEAAAILEHLEAMAVGGVPQELQVKIKAWSQHYGAATVQTLTLVQFRDQAALDELRSSDPSLARYLTPFKPEAGLGLAVVAPEDVAAMSALLIERGVDLRS